MSKQVTTILLYQWEIKSNVFSLCVTPFFTSGLFPAMIWSISSCQLSMCQNVPALETVAKTSPHSRQSPKRGVDWAMDRAFAKSVYGTTSPLYEYEYVEGSKRKRGRRPAFSQRKHILRDRKRFITTHHGMASTLKALLRNPKSRRKPFYFRVVAKFMRNYLSKQICAWELIFW